MQWYIHPSHFPLFPLRNSWISSGVFVFFLSFLAYVEGGAFSFFRMCPKDVATGGLRAGPHQRITDVPGETFPYLEDSKKFAYVTLSYLMTL